MTWRWTNNMQMLSRNMLLAAAISMPCLLATDAAAVEVSDFIAITGAIVDAPLCIINNGNMIDINFGDRIGVNTIDGTNYRSRLNYQVRCDMPQPGGTSLTLMLTTANPAAFDADDASILTNKEGLAIKVYQDNQPMTLGKRFKIAMTRLPLLEAVPIKDSNATLTAGAFNAGATLLAEYY